MKDKKFENVKLVDTKIVSVEVGNDMLNIK
jgi:hypothetical protein